MYLLSWHVPHPVCLYTMMDLWNNKYKQTELTRIIAYDAHCTTLQNLYRQQSTIFWVLVFRKVTKSAAMLTLVCAAAVVGVTLLLGILVIIFPYDYSWLLRISDMKKIERIPGPKTVPFFGNILMFNVPPERKCQWVALYEMKVSINIKYGKYSRNCISVIRDTCISIFSPLRKKAKINGSLNSHFPTINISVRFIRFTASNFYSAIIGNYKGTVHILIRIVPYNKGLFLHQQL